MTNLVLLIWGAPETVTASESAPAAPAAPGAFAQSKGISRSPAGGATRSTKRACVRESPPSDLDAATGIEGVSVRKLFEFLTECVQWQATNELLRETVQLLDKPAKDVGKSVGNWFKEPDGTNWYFPASFNVGEFPGFYTEVDIHGSGWQIGYIVKKNLDGEQRELAETIASAPAVYCNYCLLTQPDYEAAVPDIGTVLSRNGGKGWTLDPKDDVFKLYVGNNVRQDSWAPWYDSSPCLGTFTATAIERSSATAQCAADGTWSTLVKETRTHEVRKGAPGGVVRYTNVPGEIPLVRGAVFTLTFSLRSSTVVAQRTIAHEAMCCVCMDRPPVECKVGAPVACPQGHNAVCEQCLLALYQRGRPCPLCRKPWTYEAVAPLQRRADAKARAEREAWLAAEREREAAELAHFQARQAAEAAARAAAAAAEEQRLSEKIDADLLASLVREGVAYAHARAALDVCDNDLEQAKLWLAEQPLGQLCSKFGVERESLLWRTVEKMSLAVQQRVLRELHVVQVPGALDRKWLLRVTVKLHDGKDDEVGEECGVSGVSETLRVYKVAAEMLIKVHIWNWSTERIHFAPVYIATDRREPEALTDLKGIGEEYEMPYPLQLSAGDDPDAWGIVDERNNEVLRLRFDVQ